MIEESFKHKKYSKIWLITNTWHDPQSEATLRFCTHEKEQKPKQSTNVHKNAQESEFCFLQSACRFPDFTLFFWTFDFHKNKKPWQSFDININIIYNILYVSESYKQRTFGKKKDREEEALGSLEEWYMADGCWSSLDLHHQKMVSIQQLPGNKWPLN